jgi:hypothetical protein
MGVTWDDVEEALRTLGRYVRDVDLWFSVADVVPVTDEHVARVRELVDRTFGAWPGDRSGTGASTEVAR